MLKQLPFDGEYREAVLGLSAALGFQTIIPRIGASLIGGTEGCDALGGGDYFNTPLAASQFILTLARARRDVLQAALTAPDAEALIPMLLEAQALKGQKILDLGCGPFPTYARACRAFGAEVWTVDVFAPHLFDDRSPDPLFVEVDRAFYVAQDLKRADAIISIRSRTGGEFTVVSEAHLKNGWHWDSSQLDDRVAPTQMSGGKVDFMASVTDEVELLLANGGYLLRADDLRACKVKV